MSGLSKIPMDHFAGGRNQGRMEGPERIGLVGAPGMAIRPMGDERRPVVTFGPEMPGWGSWDWVGADVMAEMGKFFRTDIKDNDFRSGHKPPAKAIDAVASGVPLAMNPDSSPVEHLGRLGFEVATPLDTQRWFSRAYWEETQRFGRALRELLSLERVGQRFRRIIEDVIKERSAQRQRACEDETGSSTVGFFSGL
jgi:hypothetical protein